MNLTLILLPIKKLISTTILSLVALTSPLIDPFTGQAQTYVCTAFVVDAARGLALTAHHCMKDGTLADGKETRTIRTDGKMSLITIEPMTKPPLRLAEKEAEIGDNVVSFGYGWGNLHVLPRMVDARPEPPPVTEESPFVCERTLVCLSGPLIPGMSGGPMVNEEGDVIGINQATNQFIGLGCGVKEIRTFINRKGK